MIDIISSYATLPLGKYNKILEISKEETLEEGARNLAILSVLTGKTRDELWALTLSEVGELTDAAGFLLAEPPTMPLLKSYIVGRFEVAPLTEARKMTAGQFIDYQSYVADKSGTDLTSRILSVFLVPVGKQYGEGYDPVELQQDIEEYLPVADADTLTAFFFAVLTTYCARIRTSLAKTAKKVKDKERRKQLAESLATLTTELASLRSGAGFGMSTRSRRLREALGTTRSACPSLNSSTSYATGMTR